MQYPFLLSHLKRLGKKEQKCLVKGLLQFVILHHASDWVLLADLNSNYCFPVHIAFTQLRPDITIFSNSLRKVILTELTCPCEDNIESWHGTKINKYLALKAITESKGCHVELFAVEAGVRGYCSKSVLCCFKKLGFNNKLIRNTIKKLSKSSMECSFGSGWPETTKGGLLLLPTVCSMTLQKKPAIHHLLCHLLSRPPSHCQMQSQFNL